MTASEFGVWKRRLYIHDVAAPPVPELGWQNIVGPVTQLLKIEEKFRQQANEPSKEQWRNLDRAVFDLYEFDETDRIVVEDGFLRAGWQWKRQRRKSAAPADPKTFWLTMLLHSCPALMRGSARGSKGGCGLKSLNCRHRRRCGLYALSSEKSLVLLLSGS